MSFISPLQNAKARLIIWLRGFVFLVNRKRFDIATHRRAAPLFSSAVFLILITAGLSSIGRADSRIESSSRLPLTLSEEGYPYKPNRFDVATELGVFEGRDPSTWVAALAGVHVGSCIAGFSATCQQYLDIIAGAATREAETYGMILLSPRWQYVNSPNRLSPFWRLFGGLSPVNRAAERSIKPMEGVGVGFITYLHPKADLRLETRVGQVDQTFALALLSIHFKTDDK